ANSPLVLGAQQMGGMDGLVAAEGASLAGLALFGLAAAGLLGGALAASLIGGGKDDGGNGGDGGDGGGRPPGQPTIDSVYDNVGDVTGPIGRGDVTDDRRPVFTGRGETPGNTIEIYDNGKKIGETVVKDDGTWEFQPDRPLADGPHDFTAVEVGKDGTPSMPSDNFDLIVDPSAPDRPVITDVIDNVGDVTGSIVSGGTTDDSMPEIRGTAQPGSRVDIYDHGTLIGSTMADAHGNWTFTPATPLADGPHAFTATATSPAGSVGLPSDPWTVIVDTSGGGEQPQKPAKPVIDDIWDNTDPDNLEPINDGDTTKDKTPVIGGEGTPGNTIIVIIDDKVVGSTIVDDEGKWTFEPEDELTDGEHKFEVIERDPEGNESDPSDPVSVIVDSGPVRPVITAVIDNVGDSQGPINPGETTDDAQPEIHGTAKPFSVVEIYDGETLLGSTTADKFGDWTFQPATPLANGPHNLTAVATDPLGRETTSDPFDFTVDIFGFGLILGVEDFNDINKGVNTSFADGETAETALFDITKVSGSTATVILGETGYTGTTKSKFLYVDGGGDGGEALRFDMKDGNTAKALTMDFTGGPITIEFYDAAGKVIWTAENVEGGMSQIVLPGTLLYASFSIIMLPDTSVLNINSLMMSDGAVPVETFSNLTEWFYFPDGETVASNLLDITKVGGSSVYVNPQSGYANTALRLDSSTTNPVGEIVRFDLQDGKTAAGLVLDYYAWGSGVIKFYDADGAEIYAADLTTSGGTQSVFLPEGLAYTSFSISNTSPSFAMDILSMSMGTASAWSQPADGIGSDAHDFGNLDGLGGDVFYVSEGEEDAIEFAGTDGTDLLKLTGSGQTLDLSNLQGKLASIEAIDLTGTGANTLKLSLGDVLEQGGQGLFIKNDTTQMLVRGGEGDKVELSDLL
ncbi:Ig-like domain-containing protein, partial [Burkholderia ubonensis]|uniref:Ig-like domain-containing protein n=1 Tax=Burkholderia ubonensis TaxID=101571 RepID=UPI001E5EC5D2